VRTQQERAGRLLRWHPKATPARARAGLRTRAKELAPLSVVIVLGSPGQVRVLAAASRGAAGTITATAVPLRYHCGRSRRPTMPATGSSATTHHSGWQRARWWPGAAALSFRRWSSCPLERISTSPMGCPVAP